MDTKNNIKLVWFRDPIYQKSLKKLSNQDSKNVIIKMNSIENNQKGKAIKWERIKKSRDKNFWSLRINRDIRVIVHKTNNECTACFVGHHDDAYDWAENKTYGKHPKTGYPQVNILRESNISENPNILDANYNYENQKRFFNLSEDDLFSIGIQKDWHNDIFNIYSESEYEKFMEENMINLPQEGAEILIEVANGMSISDAKKFQLEGDAKRINELNADNENFEKVQSFEQIYGYKNSKPLNSYIKEIDSLDWDDWLIHLNPSQNKFTSKNYSGTHKIYGGAGTGKTVVALHRTKFLLENKDNFEVNKIGLLTFSKTLAIDLKIKLDLLLKKDCQKIPEIDLLDITSLAKSVYSNAFGNNYSIASESIIRKKLKIIISDLRLENHFTIQFLISEYKNIIGPWNLWEFDKYKNFQRSGRQTQLYEKDRKIICEVLLRLKNDLKQENKISEFDLFYSASDCLKQNNPIFTHLIVDEAQDLGPEKLYFIRQLVSKNSNDIMLCGDSGQSLYKRHTSWIKHGLDIRGRSHGLKINYRTSKEIKQKADILSEQKLNLEDDQNEDRKSFSIFPGPEPKIKICNTQNEEIEKLSKWIMETLNSGSNLEDIILLARNENQLNHCKQACKKINKKFWFIDDRSNYHPGEIGICTIQRSKGLEYKSVAIIGCNKDILPDIDTLQNIGDGSDLSEFFELEKNKLYVGMTRAKENLYISAVKPVSSFLEEII